MTTGKKTKLTDGRIYEIGYLLSPMIPVESLAEKVTQNLKEPINSLDGQIVSEGEPRHFALAYPIKKNIEHRRLTFREAFFGSLRFEGDAKTVVELARKLFVVPDIIRYLLIEVPKATLLDEERAKVRVNRPPRLSTTTASKVGEGSPSPSLSTTEVIEMDKQIDQLLTTEAYVSK